MFRKIAAGVALLLSFGAASAADIYSAKDSPSASFGLPASVTGTYVQLGLGGAITSTSTAGADFGFAGFLGDFRVGYDMRQGDWVVGPLAGFSVENVTGTALKSGAAFSGNQTYGYEIGARAGRILNGDSLFYGLVAYQGQHLSLSSYNNDLAGLKLGTGVELDLKNHLTLGAEVAWVDYGAFSTANTGSVSQSEIRTTARLGYRF